MKKFTSQEIKEFVSKPMFDMNNPLVSIITPSFNQGQFIEETILSMKNQSYQNIEHIIIDGGSSDNTLNIIKKHEGTYNMRWISERDNGMYEAINKGLKMAKGEITCYLNTDDLYLPYTVGCVVEFLKKNPEIDLIFGDVIRLFLDDNIATIVISPSVEPKYLLHIGGIPQPTMFWRKKIHTIVGFFDESLQYAADLDFFLKCAVSCKIRKLNEILSIDRMHKKQLREIYKQKIENEIEFIRKRYNINHSGLLKKIKYNLLRYYAHGKTRIDMISFLIRYVTNSASSGNWEYFFSFIRAKGTELAPTSELFLRLVPFFKKNYKRWYVKSSYKELITP